MKKTIHIQNSNYTYSITYAWLVDHAREDKKNQHFVFNNETEAVKYLAERFSLDKDKIKFVD